MTEIVAEIGGNHGGKLENALRLIEAAADAGADAVKFQCFEPYPLAFRRAKNPQVLALAGNQTLVDLYTQIHTPKAWFPLLIEHAKKNRLAWFSSVFSPEDVDFLEWFDCPRYKISAFEMLDTDIIEAVKETGKPIVLSVRPIPGVTILEATHYDGRFEPLGLSAHGAIIPADPVPMIEYHLKLDDVPTIDDAFSLSPADFQQATAMVRAQIKKKAAPEGAA
jgi:sialic acid synthase SpsE